MFTQVFPIIATTDMAGALRFYRDHLGIGLSPDIARTPAPRPISLWVYADDCDAAVEQLRSAGVTVTEEPADQPWRERVARVFGPDGNEVIIGQQAAS